MATTAILEDRVGYRLGITISSSSFPTTTDVQSWLTEAAYKIAKKAPVHLLQNLINVKVATMNTSTIDISSLTGYCRPVALTYMWAPGLSNRTTTPAAPIYDPISVEAKFLEPSSFYKVTGPGLGGHPFFSVDVWTPVYTISGGTLRVRPGVSQVSGAYQTVPPGIWFTTGENTTLDSATDYICAITSSPEILVGGYYRIEDEIIRIDYIAGDNCTVSRGMLGSIAVAHTAKSVNEPLGLMADGSVGADLVQLQYIKYPTDASGMSEHWEELMVDYATMMAKLQDEELVDAQVFGQLFSGEMGGGQ